MVPKELTEGPTYSEITRISLRRLRNIPQAINQNRSNRIKHPIQIRISKVSKVKETVQRKREEGGEETARRKVVETNLVSNRNSDVVYFIAF